MEENVMNEVETVVENVGAVEKIANTVEKTKFLNTGWGKVTLIAGTAVATEAIAYGVKKLIKYGKKKFEERKAKKSTTIEVEGPFDPKDKKNKK